MRIACAGVLAAFILSSKADGAAPAQTPRTPLGRCQTSLTAEIWPSVRGLQLARVLYPSLDPSLPNWGMSPDTKLIACDAAAMPKGQQAATVLLAFSNPATPGKTRVEVAVIRREATGLKVGARNPDALADSSLQARRVDFTGDLGVTSVEHLALDRAVYRISPNEIAVGVRFDTGNPADGPNALLFGFEELALFRILEGRLEIALSITVSEQATVVHCDPADGDCGENTWKAYVIAISKRKTKGFFDLIRRQVGGSDLSGIGERLVLRWTGSQYGTE